MTAHNVSAQSPYLAPPLLLLRGQCPRCHHRGASRLVRPVRARLLLYTDEKLR